MYFKVLRKYDEKAKLLPRQNWDELTRIIDDQKDLIYPFCHYNKNGDGIFLTDAENVLVTLYQGDKIALITIPDNTDFVCIEDEVDPEAAQDGPLIQEYQSNVYNGFFRARKVNVIQVLDIWEIETFELFKKIGIDFQNYGGIALESAAEKGHLDIVKYLINEGLVEPESFGIYSAITLADERGYKEIADYLHKIRIKNINK